MKKHGGGSDRAGSGRKREKEKDDERRRSEKKREKKKDNERRRSEVATSALAWPSKFKL